MYSFHYFTGRGDHYRTQYNFNFGIISEPFDQMKLNIFVDYRIKYLDPGEKSDNDSFFRAKIEYDIK